MVLLPLCAAPAAAVDPSWRGMLSYGALGKQMGSMSCDGLTSLLGCEQLRLSACHQCALLMHCVMS